VDLRCVGDDGWPGLAESPFDAVAGGGVQLTFAQPPAA